MHKTEAEARSYVAELAPLLSGLEAVEVVVCPPFTALAATIEALHSSPVEVYAQTMHQAESGGHTGEVSPASSRSSAWARARPSATAATPSAACATKSRRGSRRCPTTPWPTW